MTKIRPSLERFIVIRRGPVWYEWRYREENPSKFRTTKVPRGLSPKDALDLVAHSYLELHPNDMLTCGWELTDEEKAAGKKGITESEVDDLLKSREDHMV
jgi:hypothetical protein